MLLINILNISINLNKYKYIIDKKINNKFYKTFTLRIIKLIAILLYIFRIILELYFLNLVLQQEFYL